MSTDQLSWLRATQAESLTTQQKAALNQEGKEAVEEIIGEGIDAEESTENNDGGTDNRNGGKDKTNGHKTSGTGEDIAALITKPRLLYGNFFWLWNSAECI